MNLDKLKISLSEMENALKVESVENEAAADILSDAFDVIKHEYNKTLSDALRDVDRDGEKMVKRLIKEYEKVLKIHLKIINDLRR